METFATESDEVQAYAAGVAEGLLFSGFCRSIDFLELTSSLSLLVVCACLSLSATTDSRQCLHRERLSLESERTRRRERNKQDEMNECMTGELTRLQIYYHYRNTIQTLCVGYRNYCAKLYKVSVPL